MRTEHEEVAGRYEMRLKTSSSVEIPLARAAGTRLARASSSALRSRSVSIARRTYWLSVSASARASFSRRRLVPFGTRIVRVSYTGPTL